MPSSFNRETFRPFRPHCFDYLYFEFRTVSSIWHSFWHVYSPFFYFITFVYLWGCSSLAEPFYCLSGAAFEVRSGEKLVPLHKLW